MPDTLISRALAAVAPHADTAAWAAALAAPMQSSGITNIRRVAMFIGQCAVESTGFTVLVENLNYRPETICAEWPTHFVPGSSLVAACAHNPEHLANTVYANRLGNGDESSGDGWRFCGRGPIQTTGRTAYGRFARAVGRPLNDAFLAWCETIEGGAQSACFWWSQRPVLLSLSDAWDVAGVTRIVNGALGAYPARLTACGAALRALGGAGGVPDRVVAHAGPTPGETEADRLMNQFNAPGGIPVTHGA